MFRIASLLIISAMGFVLLGEQPGLSQSTLRNSVAERRQALEERDKQQQMQREIRSERIRQAVQARSEKRASCSKQAKDQKLSFLNRRRFLRECMTR